MLCYPPRSDVLDNLGRLALEFETLTSQLKQMHRTQPSRTHNLGIARSRSTEFVQGADLRALRELLQQSVQTSCISPGCHRAVHSRRLLQHVVDHKRGAEDLLFATVLEVGANIDFECHEMWHFDEREECTSVEVSLKIDPTDSVIVAFRMSITLCATLRGPSCKFDSVLYANSRDCDMDVGLDVLEQLEQVHRTYLATLCDDLTPKQIVSNKRKQSVRFDQNCKNDDLVEREVSSGFRHTTQDLKPPADTTDLGGLSLPEAAEDLPRKECKAHSDVDVSGPRAALSPVAENATSNKASQSLTRKPFQRSIRRRGGVQTSTESVFNGLKEQFNAMEKLEQPSDSTYLSDGFTTEDIEFIRILTPSQFKLFLEKHGVPVCDYGSAILKTKSVKDLFAEVVLRECSLIRISNPDVTSGFSLERKVRVVFLEIEAVCDNVPYFLLLKDEISDNSIRTGLNTRPSKKMFDDEDVECATWRCLYQNFDITKTDAPRKSNFEVISVEHMTERKGSAGFPGLPTVYDVNVVHIRVCDPSQQEFSQIGLPKGDEFKTISYFISHTSTRCWRWCSLEEFQKAKAATAGTKIGGDDSESDRTPGQTPVP